MGLFDCFCNVVSNVVSAVGGAIGSIANSLSSTIEKMSPTLTKLGIGFSKALSIVGTVMQVIGIITGMLKQEEKIEDTGEKVLQAKEHGITFESCDKDFKKYKEEIDKFEINPDKKHSTDECLVAGISYVDLGLQETHSNLAMNGLYPMLVSHQNFFSPERLAVYASLAKDMGFNLNKIASYMNGTCRYNDINKIEDFMHRAESKFDTNYNKENFDDKLNAMKLEIRS